VPPCKTGGAFYQPAIGGEFSTLHRRHVIPFAAAGGRQATNGHAARPVVVIAPDLQILRVFRVMTGYDGLGRILAQR